jgi:hypothetical protein
MQESQITLAYGLHMPCMGEQKQWRHSPMPTKAPTRRSSRRRTSEAPRTPDLIEGEPCPLDGCTLSWPRWHDGQPKCKLCALEVVGDFGVNIALCLTAYALGIYIEGAECEPTSLSR